MNMTGSRGSVLINLIVGMTLVAILGAGMAYMTTTSTYTELFANRQARAYYLAEAGGRYAMKLLADNTGNPNFYPGGKSPAPPTTFTLAGGDQFTMTSYDFIKDGVSDPTRVVVESIGVVQPGAWIEAKRKITYIMSRSNPIPGGEKFVDFVVEKDVFVYGSTMSFSGGSVNGPGATIVIRGNLDTDQINMGASVAATTIYVDGYVELNGGSAALGSSVQPGNIYINGRLDLWNGTRNIYGDVHVNGNFRLKDARVYGNVYVNGTVELGWTPYLAANSHIYYTGDGNPNTPDLIYPANYNASILAKCIKQASVPGFTMPGYAIPAPRTNDWFAARGYLSSGALVSGLKIFSQGSYVSSSWRPTANNVIIVSKGDIRITGLGASGLTGVLYAPYGKVTFNGGFFTGLVIARDGFFVTSGGTTVTFQGIENYISSPDDYPFLPDESIIQY